MLFSWLRNRRRRKLLAGPFPVRWEAVLRANVGHYPRLSAGEQARLRDITRVLVAEKAWEGGSGLFITEEMKVTIAAEAALLLLGREHDYYERVSLVVVYPNKFRSPVREEGFDGGWEDDWLSDTETEGEAQDRGAVLLSWDDVIAEARNPGCGSNLAIHEFAHVLDPYANQYAPPSLGDPELEARWLYVTRTAFEDHRREVNRGEKKTFFTPHAAENEAEFFADATEAFFCQPGDMKEDYPELYQLFAAYYRVDPVKWFAESV